MSKTVPILRASVLTTALGGALSILAAFFVQPVLGQTAPGQPTYRVANEPSGLAPADATGVHPVLAHLNLEPQNNEHPLMPVIRVAKQTLAHIDQNISDYSCTLVKHERLNGELGEKQHILMKVRHEPFSVYMNFLKPHAGRKVLYLADQNDGELLAREAGLFRLAGWVSLDPEGPMAMREQKHPITDVGIRNLMAKFIEHMEQDARFQECTVKSNPNYEFAGRPSVLIHVEHPIPRRNFSFHIARVCIDKELLVPIYYDSYKWSAGEGGQPPLEESYAYTNLKINNGFTAKDFTKESAEAAD